MRLAFGSALALVVVSGPGGVMASLPSEPPPLPPASADPAFVATIEPIGDELAAEMTGVSWRAGCPAALEDLRLISMNHWGFDGDVHAGEMVVHASVARDVADVFGEMFSARYPIAQMRRVEAFDGDDDASMAADNTSAFNCREITGGGAFSVHSWGMAIDINPVENPYLKGSAVLPPAGEAFLDRHDVRPGMIVAGDPVVAAFASRGFEWGGDWSSLRDYQHFEMPDPERVADDWASATGSTESPPPR